MDPLNEEFIRLLKRSGLNQTRAAELLHLTQGVVSQYVHGLTRPSETVIRLFRLETGDAETRLSVVRESLGSVLSDAEFGLIEAIRRMPKDQQSAFIRNVKGLARQLEEPRSYPKAKRAKKKAKKK